MKRTIIEIEKDSLTIIRGIRRSGKTVYLKQLVKDLIEKGVEPSKILYISCDRLNRVQLRNIVTEFRIRSDDCFLFLDEITYVQDWQFLLKELMEDGGITIVATGSNPLQMKKRTERLPGRGVEGNEYYFNPFSFREFVLALDGKELGMLGGSLADAVRTIVDMDIGFDITKPQIEKLIPYYEDLERLFYYYNLTGGFPRATVDLLTAGKIEQDTYESIIRMVLGTISKEGKDERTAQALLERLLITNSSRTDYSTLGKSIDVHHTTVKDYIGMLEDSRILFQLLAWDLSNSRHSIRKQKKMIFQSSLIPIALHIYLRGGDWKDAQIFYDQNQEWIVENLVSAQMIWSMEQPLMREAHSFSGFHYNRKECDLVILDRDGSFYGFESKYGKLEKAKMPFKTIYLTKSEMDQDSLPVSLYLMGIKKSKWCL